MRNAWHTEINNQNKITNYYDVLPNVFTLILLCLFCIDELFTAA